MIKSFKLEKDGSYQLLVDNNKSGIFLHIPEKYKIDDYNIVLTGDEFKPSKRAHFTLLGEPRKMGEIKIDAGANISCKKDINISVKQFLRLGKNDNFSINAYGSTSVCYDDLDIFNNTDTEVTLVRENPRPYSIDESHIIPIVTTSIRNNNNCIFSLGTDIKKFNISNNKAAITPFKLSVSGAYYLYIEDNRVDPFSKEAVIFADVSGGFLLRDTEMKIRGKNHIRNIHELSDNEEPPLVSFKDGKFDIANATIETNARNFIINAKGKSVKLEEDIKIKTGKEAAITGVNSLENIRISYPGRSIYLRDNGLLKDSVVEFAQETNKTYGGRTILKSAFTNARITNVADDLSLSVDRCFHDVDQIICDGISMRGESNISISLLRAVFHNAKISMPITLEKINIDAHSKVEVGIDPGDDGRESISLPVELKNVNFDRNNLFELSHGIKAQNCSFKKLSYTSSFDDIDKVQKLENTICEGVINLKNVEKISCCDIKNLELLNKEEIQLNGELFEDQKISDYESFTQKREGNSLTKEDSRATDDLELL